MRVVHLENASVNIRRKSRGSYYEKICCVGRCGCQVGFSRPVSGGDSYRAVFML